MDESCDLPDVGSDSKTLGGTVSDWREGLSGSGNFPTGWSLPVSDVETKASWGVEAGGDSSVGIAGGALSSFGATGLAFPSDTGSVEGPALGVGWRVAVLTDVTGWGTTMGVDEAVGARLSGASLGGCLAESDLYCEAKGAEKFPDDT